MKKSVAVIFVFAVIALFLVASNGLSSLTGWQILDLPEPPPVPGMTSDQVVATPVPTAAPVATPVPTAETANLPTGTDMAAVLARLDAIEKLLPGWEERLNNIEAQVAIASNIVSRLDAMQSQIDALNIDVSNLKNRPSVEAPFFEQLSGLQGAVKRNTVLSILLSVIALAIVIAMIGTAIVNHKKDMVENKRLIKNYLINYQKAGYKLETLRMHLRACGWKDDFVNEAVRELPKQV